MVLLGGHGLGEFVALCQYVAALTDASRELELCPLLACAFALQDVDVEIGKLGIVEVEVGRTVGVRVQQVGTGPVEHRHEIVADAVDALCREVAQRLLIDLDLLVAVGAAVFDGLHDGEALYDAPAHAVALDVLTQVADLLAGPDLSEGHVVKCGDDALNSDLSQLGKGDLVFLAKPSPCSFHIIFL